MKLNAVGVDLSKSVFQLSVTSSFGRVVSRRRAFGHQVTLLHAHYVKACVRLNKTDAADADALIQAAQDPDLKPIPVKSEQQQALQLLHRIREQWKSARVARINAERNCPEIPRRRERVVPSERDRR